MPDTRQPNESWSSRDHVFPTAQPSKPETEKMPAPPAEKNPKETAPKRVLSKPKKTKH